jgi:hypothetical protein
LDGIFNSILKNSRYAALFNKDAFAKTLTMAKQKFRPARLGGFSGLMASIQYVEILKKRRNAAGRTFCDAINKNGFPGNRTRPNGNTP